MDNFSVVVKRVDFPNYPWYYRVTDIVTQTTVMGRVRTKEEADQSVQDAQQRLRKVVI